MFLCALVTIFKGLVAELFCALNLKGSHNRNLDDYTAFTCASTCLVHSFYPFVIEVSIGLLLTGRYAYILRLYVYYSPGWCNSYIVHSIGI